MTMWQRGIDICIVRTFSPEIVKGSLIPFELQAKVKLNSNGQTIYGWEP